MSTVTAPRLAEPAAIPGRRMGVTRERRPAPRSQRLIVIAAAAVVIAALAAFLAIRLSSTSGPAPTSCGSPSAGVGTHAAVNAKPAAAPGASATGHLCEGG